MKIVVGQVYKSTTPEYQPHYILISKVGRTHATCYVYFLYDDANPQGKEERPYEIERYEFTDEAGYYRFEPTMNEKVLNLLFL